MAKQHLKMLCGDYQCLANIARDRGSDPQCRLCSSSSAPPETITHILLQCTATMDSRSRVWPEFLNTVAVIFPNNQILSNATAPELAAQQMATELTSATPELPRQYCYTVHSERTNKLKKLGLIT